MTALVYENLLAAIGAAPALPGAGAKIGRPCTTPQHPARTLTPFQPVITADAARRSPVARLGFSA
jgi:hypothetical protein